MIDWNPVIRAGAHLTGAFAVPAAGAFASSLAMHGIEGMANLGINLYNQNHPEKSIEPFEINPKVKNAIKFISSAIVGITYAYATLGTEVNQFADTGIFQAEQYIADIGGSLGGIFAFHKLDIKDTAASFMNKIWGLSKVITKPINNLEEKIAGKNKDNPENIANIEVENIDFNSETQKMKKEEPQVWEVSLYEDSSKVQNAQKLQDQEIPDMTVQTLHVSELKTTIEPSNNKLVDDEIDK